MRIDSYRTFLKNFGASENVEEEPENTMDDETIQKLMRLKRHETPPEGYFDDFLTEFHRRQRQDVLKRSSFTLFMERLNTYLSDPRSQGWAYAPVVAAFLVAFYCIIGFTDDSPMPSLPSVAAVEYFQQQQQQTSLGEADLTTVAYRGPTTLLGDLPQAEKPDQAAVFPSNLEELSGETWLSDIALENTTLQ